MSALVLDPILTLPRVAAAAAGDLVATAVPASPTERERWLQSGIGGVSIDTRSLAPGDLFVPLKGEHVDGHRFLAAAFERGAAAALCERAVYPEWQGREPGPLVVVDDATAALQRLARRWREEWHGELVAVTGSNGKTTTKDMVAAVLATRWKVLKTEGNLNNHWGVPLTLLRLRPEHEGAVVEMGMSHAGEIRALCAVARPDAGVITNTGEAHLEHLGSLEAVAAAKAELAFALAPGAPLFANGDQPLLLAALRGAPCRVITFGLGEGAELRARSVETLGRDGVRLEVDGFPPVRLRLPGRHQAVNALAALAVARALGLDPEASVHALEACRPGGMRMELREHAGALLLVDCYNASPSSSRAALETLATWPEATRRLAVLGDMLELGPEAPRLHESTAAAARDVEVWTVGRFAADTARGARGAGLEVRVFEDKPALAAALAAALRPGVVALVKASRGARLEEVLPPTGEGT